MKLLKSLSVFALFAFSNVVAQHSEKCGTMTKFKEDPTYAHGVLEAEFRAEQWLRANQNFLKNNAGETFDIPVVVHVIYNELDSTQNIHDSLIYSQIDVLNEDFARLNADSNNTRAIFDSVAADTKLRFVLANTDPQGNTTTGITRTSTTKESFDIFTDGMESMKSTATGGVDAWPTNKYLNLWVCKMTIFGLENSLLGFAQFPSNMPESEGGAETYVGETDGVVINYLHFGRSLNPDIAPNNLGRTCVHEVGHWFGLRHIWADEGDQFGNPGDCTQDDFVDDTPMANQASQFSCDTVRNSCSNDAAFSNNYWTNNPPDMVENYMDYSGDECMNMFTKGQVVRMHSFLNTARRELIGGEPFSVNEINMKEISLYPNPVNDQLNIKLSEYTQGQVVIVNTLGVVVKSQKVNGINTTINTSDLNNGVYYINIEGADFFAPKSVIIAH